MVYGVSSQELPAKEFDRFARICSASSGLGCCFSLVAGSFLFSVGGYFLPYLMLSGSFIILIFMIKLSRVLDETFNTASIFDEELSSLQYDSYIMEQKGPQMTTNFALSIPVSMND